MEVIENEAGRFYVIEGKKYPSMTTVLGVNKGDFLKEWRERIGEAEADKIMAYACDRGNAIHKMAEDYLTTGEYDKSNFYYNALFRPIKKWLDANVLNVVLMEEVLWSHKLKIAGRTDLIAETTTGLRIIDFKTSSKVKEIEWIKDYFLQATGYSYCYREMTGTNIQDFTILIVNEQTFDINTFNGKADEHIRDLAETRLKYKMLTSM